MAGLADQLGRWIGKEESKNMSSFKFRPGWMIINTSSASGGIHYDRTLIEENSFNRGHGVQTQHNTRKTVDHVEFCAAIDAIVKKVDYVLRKHCTRTEMGWFAAEKDLATVKAEISALEVEAADLNAQADRAHSARQAKIRIVPLRLDLNHPEAVQEIAGTIRGVLADYITVLRDGDILSLHKLKIRAINLDKLAVGFQADAIRFALAHVPIAANLIRTAKKIAERTARQAAEAAAHAKGLDDEATEEAVESAVKWASVEAASHAGSKLDLEIIEAALAHFQDSVYVADAAVG